MRCFIAIDVDDEKIKNEIIKLQIEIKDYDVKLVEEKNLHFTLKFLGEISKQTIEIIKEKLQNIAKNHSPFEIGFYGIGVFPSINYIRVIWVGVENKELFNLQNTIENELSDIFKKEEPKPHLTIARVRTPKHKKELADFVNKNKHIWLGKMKVNKIKLKKSTLTPKGPIYEDIKIFELG
ncbi:MAG: RNA 2',3'-cyclic phosphodiesterase [Candidatus Aenigmatarchaeota archaeon]